MNITNKLGLPEALVQAVKNDPYSKGDSDFSVTELLAPVQQRALMNKYNDQLSEDVSDRLWSLYGQIAHSIIERSNTSELVEKRFSIEIDKFKVSGQIDSFNQETGLLTDYKFTSAWGFMANRDPKPEWVLQMNMQKFILGQNGIKVRKLQIVGLLRDWSFDKAARDKAYPATQIARHNIPVMSDDAIYEFMAQAVKDHAESRKQGGKIPACTKEETWNGRRCQNYCLVNRFCSQYNHNRKD